MSTRSGYRKLELLQNASLWQEHCLARSSLSIYLSDEHKQANAALSRYRDYLGHEFDNVFIDCRAGLHADAIAALCGTVTAGGLLSILLPVESNPMSQRMIHFASKVYQKQVDNSASEMLIPTAISDTTRHPTDEQQTILQLLDNARQDTTQQPQTHIITAERGRGKSTLLGQALSKAQNQSTIIVTAPRKANAKVLLEQAPQARFVAWDKLLEQPGNPDTQLIIDEAAGLPLWAIEKLCEKFTPWLLATTVAGYEGCGRGFAVHFIDWAKSTLPHVGIHQLTQPLRWPVNDPLEQWLAETFLLDEQAAAVSSNRVTGTFIQHASELEESLLLQCFQLLLNAHYQSSPNDLNLLLTEPAHKLAYRCAHGKVIAVAWLMSEGPVNSPLKEEIKFGRRRPKGNLLPQAVGYFLQQEWAMDLHWLRVARIAVPENKRRQKAASTLLAEILLWAKNQNFQMLGTSFAWSPQLDHFWQKNHYSPWRFSSRIDSVSARPAAIYVCSLAESVNDRYALLNLWGQQQLQWLSKGKEALSSTEGLDHIRTEIIQAYVAKIIPFDAAHFSLAQWFYWLHKSHPLTDVLCQPDTTLKQLGHYWGGQSQRQTNENLCKEVQSLH